MAKSSIKHLIPLTILVLSVFAQISAGAEQQRYFVVKNDCNSQFTSLHSTSLSEAQNISVTEPFVEIEEGARVDKVFAVIGNSLDGILTSFHPSIPSDVINKDFLNRLPQNRFIFPVLRV